jgi:hypothetical protein
MQHDTHRLYLTRTKAREGHRIVWVMKGRRYLAQVRDGEFYDLRKK